MMSIQCDHSSSRPDASVLAKIQGSLLMLYAKFKNERRTLIGCWLAQKLIAVGDVQVMDCTCWTLTFVMYSVHTTCVCIMYIQHVYACIVYMCGIKRGQN